MVFNTLLDGFFRLKVSISFAATIVFSVINKWSTLLDMDIEEYFP
jgi:hypothetical protein